MKQNEFHSSEVFALNGSIDYAKNAIVSKTVIKKTGGSITLFAFDQGEELSEHTTAYDAMVQIVDGTADISISGQLFNLRSGESIILPGNVPHAVRARERFKMLLMMIK